MTTFWCAFDLRNGMVATWTGDADNVDAFVEELLKQDYRRNNIIRITEIQEHVTEWPTKPNIQVPVAKHNTRLKSIQKGKP